MISTSASSWNPSSRPPSGPWPSPSRVTGGVVHRDRFGDHRAANAFLTLRVGIVAKRYCGSLVVVEKRGLRRMATAEAAKLLGTIVKQGSARLTKILWSASKGR